jgi:hypothetical protein
MKRHLPRIRSQRQPRLVGRLNDNPREINDWLYQALIVSEPHYRLSNGEWSGGGPFYTYSAQLEHRNVIDHSSWWEWGNNHGPYRIGGVGPLAFLPFPSGVPYVPWNVISKDLIELFPNAYRRARPGSPQAGLGQFLVELKEFPRIPGKSLFRQGVPVSQIPATLRARLAEFLGKPYKGGPNEVALRGGSNEAIAKFRPFGRERSSLSHEYLNYEFGWRLLVNDIKAMHALTKSIDRHIYDILSRNGRNTRRKIRYPEETTDGETYTADVPYNYWDVGGAPNNHVWRDSRTTLRYEATVITRTWGSFGFHYWIPDTSSPVWQAKALSVLYGVAPTPQLLWDLLPWSWLGDWFTNIGDVVSNISVNAVDNLVVRYAYLMRNTITTRRCIADCSHSGSSSPGWQEWPQLPLTRFESLYKEETKLRVEGNVLSPYSLGSTPDDLSSRQVAILAALGTSPGGVRAYKR